MGARSANVRNGWFSDAGVAARNPQCHPQDMGRRRRILLVAASLAVLLLLLLYLLMPAKVSATDRLMDEIETKFKAQVPGAKLSNFSRVYARYDDHTVIGLYQATNAEPVPINAGRRWGSREEAIIGTDRPCYYNYQLWFDLPTKKLMVFCGSDGTRDPGPAPPGLG